MHARPQVKTYSEEVEMRMAAALKQKAYTSNRGLQLLSFEEGILKRENIPAAIPDYMLAKYNLAREMLATAIDREEPHGLDHI